MSTSSGGQKYSIVFGGQFLTPPEGAVCQDTSRLVLSETKCRGCDFDKSSLRGNLARTTKECKNLYTAEELSKLKENAGDEY